MCLRSCEQRKHAAGRHPIPKLIYYSRCGLQRAVARSEITPDKGGIGQPGHSPGERQLQGPNRIQRRKFGMETRMGHRSKSIPPYLNPVPYGKSNDFARSDEWWATAPGGHYKVGALQRRWTPCRVSCMWCQDGALLLSGQLKHRHFKTGKVALGSALPTHLHGGEKRSGIKATLYLTKSKNQPRRAHFYRTGRVRFCITDPSSSLRRVVR